MNSTVLIKTLIGDGVTFSTDGESIKWENGEGKITPAIVDELKRGKAEIIAFLSTHQRQEQSTRRSAPEPQKLFRRDWEPDTKAKPNDPEAYAEALRIHGAMTYGMAMQVLGWGATRAGQAEDTLRLAGRIVFNGQGRAVLSDNENHQNAVAK